MADRIPIFELHIRPMFRMIDREHMLRVNAAIDLWDYDSVRAHADRIVLRCTGNAPSMPTSDVGGAWPVEWQSLFKRWIDGGYRRLALGIGHNYRLAPAAGGSVGLSCDVDIPDAPNGDSTAWFDPEAPKDGRAVYRLHVFDGDTPAPPGDPISIQVMEIVSPADAAAGVTVIDGAGIHLVQP